MASSSGSRRDRSARWPCRPQSSDNNVYLRSRASSRSCAPSSVHQAAHSRRQRDGARVRSPCPGPPRRAGGRTGRGSRGGLARIDLQSDCYAACGPRTPCRPDTTCSRPTSRSAADRAPPRRSWTIASSARPRAGSTRVVDARLSRAAQRWFLRGYGSAEPDDWQHVRRSAALRRTEHRPVRSLTLSAPSL